MNQIFCELILKMALLELPHGCEITKQMDLEFNPRQEIKANGNEEPGDKFL